MSKISIIIPVYNGNKYLKQCKDSLLSQSYTNWEAIFINDGSTDNTEALLATLTLNDSRFKTITIKNQGVSIARDIGIRESQGEYIVFLDVDDTLPIDALQTLISNASHDIDIVHSGFNFIQDEKETSSQKINNINFNKYQYFQYILTGKLGWQLCGKLFRRTLFDDSIVIPKGIKCGEDCALLTQLISKAKKIKAIDSCCYNYHQYFTSVSHRKSNAMGLEMLKARDFVISRLEQLNELKKVSESIQIFELLCFSSAIRKGLSRKDPEAKSSIRKIKIVRLIRLPIKKIANIVLFIIR